MAKWKIRGEEGEGLGRESWRRQRGLVRRVGPRAFPRFREAYRTAALIPSAPSLEGQLSMLIQHYIRLRVYAVPLAEPGRRVPTYTCTAWLHVYVNVVLGRMPRHPLPLPAGVANEPGGSSRVSYTPSISFPPSFFL